MVDKDKLLKALYSPDVRNAINSLDPVHKQMTKGMLGMIERIIRNSKPEDLENIPLIFTIVKKILNGEIKEEDIIDKIDQTQRKNVELAFKVLSSMNAQQKQKLLNIIDAFEKEINA